MSVATTVRDSERGRRARPLEGGSRAQHSRHRTNALATSSAPAGRPFGRPHRHGGRERSRGAKRSVSRVLGGDGDTRRARRDRRRTGRQPLVHGVEGGRIGRITPSGVVTEFSAGISAKSGPSRSPRAPTATSGSPSTAANRIGRITPAGRRHRVLAGITGGGPDGDHGRARRQPLVHRARREPHRAHHPGRRVTEFPSAISRRERPLPGSPPAPTATCGSPSSRRPDRADHARGRASPSSAPASAPAAPLPASPPAPTATSGSPRAWPATASAGSPPPGVVTEFSAGISRGQRPAGITAGPDGNLWFTEFDGNRIGRITPAGVVTEFARGLSATSSPIPYAAQPQRDHRRPRWQALVHRAPREPHRADHAGRSHHRVPIDGRHPGSPSAGDGGGRRPTALPERRRLGVSRDAVGVASVRPRGACRESASAPVRSGSGLGGWRTWSCR